MSGTCYFNATVCLSFSRSCSQDCRIEGFSSVHTRSTKLPQRVFFSCFLPGRLHHLVAWQLHLDGIHLRIRIHTHTHTYTHVNVSSRLNLKGSHLPFCTVWPQWNTYYAWQKRRPLTCYLINGRKAQGQKPTTNRSSWEEWRDKPAVIGPGGSSSPP